MTDDNDPDVEANLLVKVGFEVLFWGGLAAFILLIFLLVWTP